MIDPIWLPEFKSASRERPEEQLVLRVSEVLQARRSLEHFEHYVLKGAGRDSTRSMELGTLVHLRTMQPEIFFENYICPEDIQLDDMPETIEELTAFAKERNIATPKAAKKPQLIEAIRATLPDFKTRKETMESKINGKQVLSTSAWATVERMSEALKKRVNTVIEGATVEERIYGQLGGKPVVITGQPDIVNFQIFKDSDEIAIFDLKSTVSVEPDSFGRSVYRYAYHGAAAAYVDLVQMYYKKIARFYWIGVENTEPHSVGIFCANTAMLDLGRALYRGLTKKIVKAVETQQFPGPAGTDPIDLEVAEWMMRETYETYGEEIISYGF